MTQHRLVLLILMVLNSATAFMSSSKTWNILSFQEKSFPHQLNVADLDRKIERGTNIYPASSRISVESYQHTDFKLTYLYKKAAPGREFDKPICLVHPVGIGISSWFWVKLMEAYEDNPPIYAPDLIGCGIDHGADPWDPNKAGLFFPLSWVEGIETLLETVIIPRWKQQPSWNNLLGKIAGGNGNEGCLVIAQGGLAPVGVMLAKRNPLNVGSLMLTSPPSYKDMTTPVPKKELERNFNFLQSKIFGSLAFTILESREIIRFFSNLFLFSSECDDQWLDETQKESCVDARPPVQIFNAGFLQHRSFEEELKNSKQPKVIVSGNGDKREANRLLYRSELDQCALKTIQGLNVMPWENPIGVIDLIRELGY